MYCRSMLFWTQVLCLAEQWRTSVYVNMIFLHLQKPDLSKYLLFFFIIIHWWLTPGALLLEEHLTAGICTDSPGIQSLVSWTMLMRCTYLLLYCFPECFVEWANSTHCAHFPSGFSAKQNPYPLKTLLSLWGNKAVSQTGTF